jgi:hypothetical protein
MIQDTNLDEEVYLSTEQMVWHNVIIIAEPYEHIRFGMDCSNGKDFTAHLKHEVDLTSIFR